MSRSRQMRGVKRARGRAGEKAGRGGVSAGTWQPRLSGGTFAIATLPRYLYLSLCVPALRDECNDAGVH